MNLRFKDDKNHTLKLVKEFKRRIKKCETYEDLIGEVGEFAEIMDHRVHDLVENE